jgi:hypothetical protein
MSTSARNEGTELMPPRCFFRVCMVFEGGWRLVILLSVN